MSKFLSGIVNADITLDSLGIKSENPAAKLFFSDGTENSPSFTFNNDSSTGIYRIDDSNIGLSLSGIKYLDVSIDNFTFNSRLLNVSGSKIKPSFSFINENNTGLHHKIESNMTLQVDGQQAIEIINKKVTKGIILDFTKSDTLNDDSQRNINFGSIYPLSRVENITDSSDRTVNAAVYMGVDNSFKTASDLWINWSTIDNLSIKFTTMRFGTGGTQCFFFISDNIVNTSSFNNYIEICTNSDKIRIVVTIDDVIVLDRITSNDVISTTNWIDVEILLGSGGNDILINGSSVNITNNIGNALTTVSIKDFTNLQDLTNIWFSLAGGYPNNTMELVDYYLANFYMQEKSSNSDAISTRFSNGNKLHHVEINPSALILGNGIKLNVDSTGSNAITGTAVLTSGTVTILTSSITTNSIVQITRNTPVGTLGFLYVPSASIVNETSFVINSSSSSDESTVNWFIIN